MIFLRHPVTDAVPDLCYGQLDLGWGEGAEAQVAAALAAVGPARVIRTSPLKRARLLAERFAARDGVEPIVDPRLMEYHFGAWEGRLWSDIPRAESEPWTDDLIGKAPPGGETFSALVARVGAAIEDAEDDALIICHAGPIRAACMVLAGESFETVFARKIPFCTPIALNREPA